MSRPSSERKRILGVFAHPDDESMGPGGTLAKYAARGHRVAFATATDGGAGRLDRERPANEGGRRRLKRIRQRETQAAASILGAEFLGFLGWEDGRLAEGSVLALEEAVAALLRRERPHVVITFHGSGISYHPDHRVLALAVTGAFLGSGRAGWYRSGPAAPLPPHAPAKLYAMVPKVASYWEDWPKQLYRAPIEEITTVIDTSRTAETKWRAIRAHASQQGGPPFRRLYEAGAFVEECFVRVFPSRAADSPVETDLLEGLD